MAVTQTKYQSNSGGIYKIRMDTAKQGVTGNTAPAGAITDPKVEVEVSEAGSTRKSGIHPRGVRVRRVGTGADLNKVFSVFIPALTPAALTTLSTAASIEYKGQTYTSPTIVEET